MAEARNTVTLEALDLRRPRRGSIYVDGSVEVGSDPSLQAAMQQRWSVADIVRSFYRGVNKRWNRARNTVQDGLFPSTPVLLWGDIFVVHLVRQSSLDYPRMFLRSFDVYIPGLKLVPEGLPRELTASIVMGAGVWVGGIFCVRALLKLLFRYKGFLYEGPGQSAHLTKLWGGCVKVLCYFGHPLTYSYQSFLPSLPVPSLKATCERYLESVRPLLNDVEYDRIERLATTFRSNEGPKLQLGVYLKYLVSTNYVSDWWERLVYLRVRAPILINSNYYVCDAYLWRPTDNQIARAANLMHNLIHTKDLLDSEHLPPLIMKDVVPLCMNQYVRWFGTSRIPGLEEDTIQHVPNTRHLAVLYQGYFYVFDVIDSTGHRLTACEIEKQLFEIVKDRKTAPDPGPAGKLPALTGDDRVTWYEFRTKYLSSGRNRACLEAVERALVVLCLDSESPEHAAGVKGGDPVCHGLLHGNGANRWSDKSVSCIVFKNGKAGAHCEHSWADAPVSAHLLELAFAKEFNGPGYDNVSGLNKAVAAPYHKLKAPLRLQWDFSEEAGLEIEASYERNLSRIADLDLQLLPFDVFGKGQVKKCQVSPDAFVQMALQLAYFRDSGHFAQTYESSMTRLYREGRTETVRPVSLDSVAFVKAMEDPEASDETRIALFRAAAVTHVEKYRRSMSGEGVDRHLFTLFVVSKIIGVNSEFLTEALSVPWKLSTSQTPLQQTVDWDYRSNPEKLSAGGGFGPVHDDGYGVSYIVAGEDKIMFHITSKVSSAATDSLRFASNVKKAMVDIRDLVLSKSPAKSSKPTSQ